MTRLLNFLFLLAITASISSYKTVSPPELTYDSNPVLSSTYPQEYESVKTHGPLFRFKSLRRIPVFKFRILSHYSLHREFAYTILVKQFSPLFSLYRQFPKPIGLKLIFPEHFFW